eukprot:Blabericola_migrator_1__8016@NODE_4112_length_1326_cov_8_421763_g2544_i0_p1_GENE_NODE_4112_length_1326_cov_8_421763_g2544_i0NODE_4112_length_1326_cov_8_421763_g2544_i0_p1_ORF_typecomplete_len111_score5_11_NODE_4112_length_1326_cov_8_421763_g2544_i0659991
MLFYCVSPDDDIAMIDSTTTSRSLASSFNSWTVLSILNALALVLGRWNNTPFTMVGSSVLTKEPLGSPVRYLVLFLFISSWFPVSLNSQSLECLCYFTLYSLIHMSCRLV